MSSQTHRGRRGRLGRGRRGPGAQPWWVRPAWRGGGAGRARGGGAGGAGRASEPATRKGSAPAAAALLRREAGVRLCEAPHFNEDRPRRIPALAAAAQTPALLPPPPSPGPAAPWPGRAQPGEDSARGGPSAATKTPGGVSPRTGAWFAFAWGREQWGGPAGGPAGGRAEPALPAVAGRRGSAGAEGRWAPLGRRRPACRSSKGAARSCPGRGRCVRAAPGPRAPASFVWCHRRAGNGESGERGAKAPGRRVVSGEPGRRGRARCWSLSELAAERGPSLRPEEWPGQASYCVCALPWARRVEDGGPCIWG